MPDEHVKVILGQKNYHFNLTNTMDGLIAEIRLFAGPYAPSGWHFCDGSLLPIDTNQSLFKLIGTRYGGNGVNNFALPDLRGRTVVGAKAYEPNRTYQLGDILGEESVRLNFQTMPAHNHTASLGNDENLPLGNATLFGSGNAGGHGSPEGNFLGSDNTGSGVAPYASSGTPVKMHAESIKFTDVQVAAPTVNLGLAGGGQPHSNMMPSLVLNYIICTEGIYPAEN